MYTMIFAPAWVWFGAGIRQLGLDDYVTDWPFLNFSLDDRAYFAAGILFWWTLIICVVLWYRSRPRWLAIILMLVAFLYARSVIQAVDLSIPRLAR